MGDTQMRDVGRTYVEQCMGTVFSIAVRDPGALAQLVEQAKAASSPGA